jgi:hypothetical protein
METCVRLLGVPKTCAQYGNFLVARDAEVG